MGFTQGLGEVRTKNAKCCFAKKAKMLPFWAGNDAVSRPKEYFVQGDPFSSSFQSEAGT